MLNLFSSIGKWKKGNTNATKQSWFYKIQNCHHSPLLKKKKPNWEIAILSTSKGSTTVVPNTTTFYKTFPTLPFLMHLLQELINNNLIHKNPEILKYPTKASFWRNWKAWAKLFPKIHKKVPDGCIFDTSLS